MQIGNTLFIALLFCSTIASANPQSDSALAIYQNSSAEIRVEQFSSQIGKLFMNSSADSSKVISDKIENSIERNYNPARFQKHIVGSIDSTLNWRERNKILEWLDTPLGRKASLAEAMALVTASRGGMAATIEKARGLESQSKAALVDVVEMAAMESALQLDISVHQKSIAAFASNAPKSLTAVKDFGTYLTATESRRDAISNLNHTYSRSLVSLAYADLSKPEIKAMISFWGSPTGTRFSVALSRGIANAFAEANQSFNSDVKKIISNSNLAMAN